VVTDPDLHCQRTYWEDKSLVWLVVEGVRSLRVRTLLDQRFCKLVLYHNLFHIVYLALGLAREFFSFWFIFMNKFM
jgi:hypothetical protein